jgi:hypothetical protein
MAFGGISYIAILVAAIAGFAVGAVWYTVLGRQWRQAAGISAGQNSPSPMVLLITFIAELLMAWILAGLIGHLGPGQVTVKNGLISALFVWTGFVLTTLVVNHRNSGQSWSLTLIDGAHWLLALLVMGGVIGAFGGA